MEGKELKPVSRKLSRRQAVQLLGAGALGTGLLAACGDSTATTAPAAATTAAPVAGATTAAPAPAATTAVAVKPAAGKVVFYAGKDATGNLKKQVDAFNALNNGVSIEYQEGPQDTSQVKEKLQTVLNAKDASIDLFGADIPWLPEFAAAKYMLSLDKYADAAFKGNFFEGAIQGATYKGSVYGIPWFQNVGVLYYRKDILDKAGVKPPETFEELTAAATKLQTAETYGLIYHGFKNDGLSCVFFENLWSFGADLWDPATGKITIDTPESVAAMQWMQDTIHTTKITPDKIQTFKYAEISNVFAQGNAVFARHWADATGVFEGAESKVKGLWGVKPLVNAAGKKAFGCLGNWNLAISAYSKNPDAAFKVIAHFTQLDQQKQAFINSGRVPALKTAFTDKEVLEKNSALAGVGKAFENTKPRPVSAAYPQLSAEVLQPNIQKLLAKQITPKEMIADIAARSEEIFAKFR